MNVSIGAAVRRARLLAECSQSELARKMRDRGHKWTQPTVAAIEKGERSLTWAEGMLLGDLVSFGVMWRTDPDLERDAIKYRQILKVIGGDS